MPNVLVIRNIIAKGWVCLITNKITENLIEKRKPTTIAPETQNNIVKSIIKRNVGYVYIEFPNDPDTHRAVHTHYCVGGGNF